MTSESQLLRLDSDFAPTGGEPGVLTLTLHNLSSRSLAGFRLALTSLFRVKPGSALRGGALVEQVSNYHVIAPPDGYVLQPGAAWSVSADRLSHALKHYNYGPKSAYLILADGSLASIAVSDMTLAGAPGRPLLERPPRPSLPGGAPPVAMLPFPRNVAVSGRRDATLPLSLAHGPAAAGAAFAAAARLAGRLFPAAAPLFAAAGGIVCTARHEAIADEACRIAFAHDGVSVSASGRAGFLYAFITLGQLLHGARLAPAEFSFPAAGAIEDGPRFGWRGMHLDVARQPYAVADLHRLLDCLAWQKINRFHFHLTDDEGWRIDMPGYPQVAGEAAWRGHGLAVPPLLGSPPERFGLVYSREDLRRLVAGAEDLGITIVPEVDIPGHNYCVLQAIPALRDPHETGIYRSVQYFPNNALNPAVEEGYDFLAATFAELAAIFPSSWLHVGGDEVSEEAWTGSPMALALMKARGLASVHELQSHFLQRIQAMLHDLGRGTAAWEEAALGGGIDPRNSLLFAWRKSASGLALAEQGYDIVLTPGERYYLDMGQSDEWWEPGAGWAGSASSSAAYHYDPAADWPEASKGRLKGIQACLWSENMHDKRLVDHMTFPRLSAVAETAWTPAGAKDFRRFSAIEPLMPRTGMG